MTDRDGWIEWYGGLCPVKEGTLIDVKYRDGHVEIGIPALCHLRDNGKRRQATSWNVTSIAGDIIAYRLHQVSTEEAQKSELSGEFEKQERYQDNQGEDWIDECARTMMPEEFRGAMRFTVGKYIRRLGRKDSEIKEVRKMEDYCRRWRMHLEKMESANESE